MDMKSVSQSLQRSPSRRSPNHDDPAAVLWSNYADKRGNEPLLPPLPFLELSPGTPTDSKKDAAFRRTASCGNEWPTSGHKRRKLTHQDPHSTTKQIFASKRKEMLKPQLSRQSKVSMLLESVQQSLAARQRDENEPSSSSPVPETCEHPVDGAQPPLEEKGLSPSPRKSLPPPRTMLHGSSPLKGKVDKSSDYGDLDFDDDDLEDIEDALTQGQQQMEGKPDTMTAQVPRHVGPIQPSHAGERRNEPTVSAQEEVQQNESRPPAKVPLQDDNIKIVDEFDDDDEIFDDDLQQLAEQVDSQQGMMKSVRDARRKPHALATACDGAFDDEYDDGIFDGIDAKDEAATVNAAVSAKQVRGT